MNNPTISVCLASYNGEKYIRLQIESILTQLNINDELIVSDDGSSDSTIEIVQSFNDSRITILHNRGEKGVNGNFQNALSHANGEYIFLADQDDVWLPGKITECLHALKSHMCVVHDCYVTDKDLNIINQSFFKERNSHSGLLHNWIRNGYLGCAMAFRRELLEYSLPIPNKLPVWHDIWIGLIAEYKFRVYFLPFKGMYFRRHDTNTSVTSKSRFSLSQQISYRLRVIPPLIKRLISIRKKGRELSEPL